MEIKILTYKEVISLKKRLVLMLILCVLMSISIPAYAEQTEETVKKPILVLFYKNSSNTTFDADIDAKMQDYIKKVFANYQIIEGTQYSDKLKKNGITNANTAERVDIIDVFKDESVSYVLSVEVKPFIRKEKRTVLSRSMDSTATVPVKIINIGTKKYVVNEEFIEMINYNPSFGLIGNKTPALRSLDAVIVKMDKAIQEGIPNAMPK